MNPLRWLTALLLALALVAGAMLWLQRQAAEALREEIVLLREENRAFARLRAENRRLLALQVPDAELQRLRADRAAIGRLRGEIDELKAKTDENARRAELASAPLVPAGEWRNAGRATPGAAAETMYRAVARRDVDGLAAMLSLDPPLRDQAGALFDALPEPVRAQYGTVDRLIAFSLLKDNFPAAMRVAEEKLAGENSASVIIRVLNQGGVTRVSSLHFRRTGDGWRLAVLPGAVQKIAHDFAWQSQAAR